MDRKGGCDCEGVCPLPLCAEGTGGSEATCGSGVVVPEPADGIGLEDELLVIRRHEGQSRIYQGKVRELGSEAALFLLEKAVLSMPCNDPADGRSLWLNNGVVCVASGDAGRFGTVSPETFTRSLRDALALLPTRDPGNGDPYLNGGVLMQGTLTPSGE